MSKYFNENKPYKGAEIIEFEEPIEVNLCDLGKFLESYKPFICSEVYEIERFEYGNFDNWINAIILNRSISPRFSHYHDEDEGIYKQGDVSYTIQTMFWEYQENKPFWKYAPQIGYSNDYIGGLKKIEDIKVKVHGVFVISDTDKEKIEKENI